MTTKPGHCGSIDLMHGLLEGHGGTGITLRAFRLNAAFNHLMFAGNRGRVYDRIVALTGARPGDVVLDVGSSSGFLARRLAAVVGPSGRVTGVDPSEPAIAYARRHASPEMTFTVGFAQDLGLPDASFDLVTCTLAMHHIPARQRPAVVAEMYRVTRPGGRLLIADMGSLLRMGSRSAPNATTVNGPLVDLATEAGYQIESAGKLPLLRYILATRPSAEGHR
jgi:ubiquinone/menaquinone biosynthesis C-methylase UbiE